MQQWLLAAWRRNGWRTLRDFSFSVNILRLTSSLGKYWHQNNSRDKHRLYLLRLKKPSLRKEILLRYRTKLERQLKKPLLLSLKKLLFEKTATLQLWCCLRHHFSKRTVLQSFLSLLILNFWHQQQFTHQPPITLITLKMFRKDWFRLLHRVIILYRGSMCAFQWREFSQPLSSAHRLLP